jgi:hypothetical protein
LPAVNAYDPDEGDSWDTYVFKLNSTGNGLLYATYVAGSAMDQPYDLDLDSEGNAYVCGRTQGGDFPRVNAYDSTPNGDWDVFVYKLNSTGNGLVYSTLVGGNHMDYAQGIDIDVDGNAYITGTAWSTNFPLINTIHTPDSGAPFETNLFVLKLNATGNGLDYCSIIGSASAVLNLEGNPIEVDAYGNAFVATATSSGYFPVVNPLMSRPGSYDGIVLQLNATGNGLLYSTWIGGSASDYARAIAIDSQGTAYVAGKTSSADFYTENPYDDTLHGTSDAFVAKLTDIGDEVGPEIQVVHNPEDPDTNELVTVTATIIDTHGVIEAILEYTTDGGVGWNNVTMVQSSSTWTGTIPAQSPDTEVQYRVYAQDSYGYWTISSTRSYVVQYPPTTTTTTGTSTTTSTTSTTTPPPSLELDPMLLVAIAGSIGLLVVVIIAKRRTA